MRKNIFGAVLAALAVLSACETVEPQENVINGTESEGRPVGSVPSGSGNEETFLVTASIGADTRTYLEYDWVTEVYKTRWAKEDSFYLIEDRADSLIFETCPLVDGEGTSTGTFAASLEADAYVAVYFYGGNFSEGILSANMPEEQYHWSYSADSGNKAFVNSAYPMVARSTTRDFQFENLASVLKLTVKGNGEHLEKVRVYSNDSQDLLSGIGRIDFAEGELPVMTMVSGQTYVDYRVSEYIYSDGLECYIVLPSQTYEAGFTIELHTDAGVMDVTTGENIVLEQSKLHEVPAITYQTEIDNWAICGYGTDWDNVRLSYENGCYMLNDRYLDGSFVFVNERTGERMSLDSSYSEVSCFPTHTRVNLASEDYWEKALILSTNYDIYFYPDMKIAFLTYAGQSDIPSFDDVFCPTWDRLREVADGNKVMVMGVVVATYERGFILAMNLDFNNTVLVYQGADSGYRPTMGSWVDIYAEKTTYRNLPELRYVEWNFTWIDQTYDYGYGGYHNLTSADSFLRYEGDGYDYVKYCGTLVMENDKYYVDVKDAEARRGKIEYPSQDLAGFVGQDVLVEGYFIGFVEKADGSDELCTLLKKIDILTEGDGSTEDFIPGDDIVVSSPARMK